MSCKKITNFVRSAGKLEDLCSTEQYMRQLDYLVMRFAEVR